MAIAKKPDSNKKATEKIKEEQAAEAFISGAGNTAGPGEAAGKHEKKIPMMIRFSPSVLERVDAAARRRGISRSAWIQFVVSRALDQGEG